MSEDLEEERQLTKQQVMDFVPKRIKELRFGIMAASDIVQQSVVEVSDRHVYDFANGTGQRRPTSHGPLDPRMGSTIKGARCDTCGRPDKECNGHFGHVKLALPAFHIGFMKKIIDILQCICKDCAQILLPDDQRQIFLRRVRKPGMDNIERKALSKKVNTECRKIQFCPHCGATNGAVKKVAGHALKIIHDKYRRFNASTSKTKVPPRSKVVFDQSFEEAKKSNPEIEKHMKKALDDLNPLRVLNLFRKVEASDCELLGMDPNESRPEMLIWQYVPAPPVAIRPSVQQDAASNEDDITNKLGDIIQISSILRAGIQSGQPIQNIMEQWEYLQIQVAMLINSDQPSLQQPGYGKTIRSFCQRLKGKGGRFRGNLSGKRVDFSGRTVISPDPNLSIEEVAVPERVAKNMTYPERCNTHNKAKLRKLVRAGGLKWPGANYIECQKDGRKINLSLEGETGDKIRKNAANRLEIGDLVLRHLEDGDIVLFNRQPSLHKLSIMSHRVKVREWRTFRLNECVCSPYNADFDGDEMNLHVPQTEEARTEATELMGVKYNLSTPKDGTPIIAATQDFITAAYLLSNKDRFYDRQSFTQICNYMFRGEAASDELLQEYNDGPASMNDALMNIDMPEPAIWKPQALWTGKQVFNVLIRPNKKSRVLVNLDAACKTFKAPKYGANDLAENDSWLVIRNSEIMCGLMDKATVGGGKKDSLFYVLMRDFGPDAATRCMNRLARLAARWLTNEGFSIGITDVYPGAELVRRKTELIAAAYDECDKVIKAYKDDTLERVAGSSPEDVMEKKMSEALSSVRQKAAEICFEELTRWNSPVIMAQSGSKGSNINVSQMVASVGQQIIGGQRIGDGFQDRSLPHFPKAARQPPSRGFVANSFFSGLTPSEFIFHAMSGREGLVDTAVKTAETGYMSRRLMKSLEDLSASYDMTVRTAANNVVQFAYGQDGLDPADMEGKGKPVNYERTWLHAKTVTWDNEHAGILPWQVMQHTKSVLDRERAKYVRKSLLNVSQDYYAQHAQDSDDKEFARRFLDEIEEFVGQLVDKLASTRSNFGLDAGLAETHSKKRSTKKRELPLESHKIAIVNSVAKISQAALDEFLKTCLEKYERARVQPGHAVGAVGAQSIGEPGTQMTLKTFHFAGVAGMSMTQGVPRIKEIINASKTISTPIIKCKLHNPYDFRAATIARAQIEKTYLRDVITSIDEVWQRDTVRVEVKVDMATVERLGLDLTMRDIRLAVAKQKGLGITDDCIQYGKSGRLNIVLPETPTGPKSRAKADKEQEEYFIRLQSLMRSIPDVVIKGYKDVTKCVVSKTKDENDPTKTFHMLYVEGYGLRECMTTDGVVFASVDPNNVMEVRNVLGIEAARASIIKEINQVLGSQMDIDPRHMQLLADVMTFKGDVLGITRFGLAKMRDSVLQLASFEKTPDHLFDAAINGKSDEVQGVSESIIMGQSMVVGTGAMRIVKLLDLEEKDFQMKPTVFEDEWNRDGASAVVAAA